MMAKRGRRSRMDGDHNTNTAESREGSRQGGDDEDFTRTSDNGRARCASAAFEEVGFIAGSYQRSSVSHIQRPRSQSSASATSARRRASAQGRSRGQSADMSALSVEIAVADARKSISPKHGQQQRDSGERGAYSAAPTRRSKSITGGSASALSSARASSFLSQERRGGNTAQVRPEDSDSSEVGEAADVSDEDNSSQVVIRKHRPQRSIPSVIDLFNLPPRPASTLTSPRRHNVKSSSRRKSEILGQAAALLAEDLAVSLNSSAARPHEANDGQHPLRPNGEMETSDDASAQSHSSFGRGARKSRTTSPHRRDHAQQSPVPSDVDRRNDGRPNGRPSPVKARSLASKDGADRVSPEGPSSAAANTPVAPGSRSSSVASPTGSGAAPEAGGSASRPVRVGARSHDQAIKDAQQRLQEDENEDDEEQEEALSDLTPSSCHVPEGSAPWSRGEARGETAEDLAYRELDERGASSFSARTFRNFVRNSRGTGMEDPLFYSNSPRDPARTGDEVGADSSRRWQLSGAFSGRTSGPVAFERREYGTGFGAAEGRYHADTEGEADFSALENGVRQQHPSMQLSETAKTTSQTETPVSKCGTPRSRGGGSVRSRVASAASSYPNSLDFSRRSEAPRSPSTRFQNVAKHVSDQNRGVTTSYKNAAEDMFTRFHKIALFLVTMGTIIGLGSHGIDEGTTQIRALKWLFVDKGGALLGNSTAARFALFWLYDVVLTGTAALLTSYYAPGMEGSGIPAMKYMMDTDDLANKLKSFTILAVAVKAGGLMLAAGGGLNIGREGPYTHMAGMVSFQLIKNVPFFRDILAKESVLRQVLAASVAVGVSSTFAATIGGVLFSIEITTLYYDVGNYFKAFVAAISGTVAVSLLRTIAEGSAEYIEREFSKDEFQVWQYPVCALIGVMCGFMGPLYVNFRLHLLKLARRFGRHPLRNDADRKWEYVRAATAVACLVATLTAVLTFFPGEYTRLAPLAMFKVLLSEGELPDYWSLGYTNSLFVSLIVAFVTWVMTAALGTSAAVPSGDFIQTVVIGATLGRFIGEALAANLGESFGVAPSTFALVGAASLSCGATQTISAAVVIMEMTGSFTLNKPILVGAVVSFSFSRKFGLNIYDSVMALNGLESLYGLDMRRSEEMFAKDIMQTDLSVVPCETTVGEVLNLLRGGEDGARMFESYPVVTGLDGMAFVGTISRKDLVYIVLTGGTRPCNDPDFFDYVLQRLPSKDVSPSWERMSEWLHASEREDLFDRLPQELKQQLLRATASGGGGNTVRALKVFGDKLGQNLSLIRASTRTFGKRLAPSDPRDRNTFNTRMTINSLWRSNWDPEVMADPYGSRPVDITTIAQRPSADVQIDRSVWKAHESMPLKNVYLLFTHLRCIRLFVISGDRLTGIISRSILYQALSQVFVNEPGRTHNERSRPPQMARQLGNKKKHWFDVLLGRGPRHGL